MDKRGEGLIAFFGTSDLEATDRFYREIMGLTLYKDQGVCRIYLVPGGGMIGFCSHMQVTQAGKSPIITFVQDDVEGMFERMVQAGVKVLHAPEENSFFKIFHFFVEDPAGYTVEVQRFLD